MEVAIREEVRVSAAAMAGTGRSFPLGATLVEGGANFSVFSRTADCIELLLFDREDDIRPSRVIRMDPCENRTYHYWHVFVPGLKAGQIYGFRAIGPYDPDQGLRFDPSKVLLDPYGRAITVPKSYNREAARHAGDNTATAMKSVVADPHAYDWEGDAPLHRPWARTIIYESARARLYRTSQFRRCRHRNAAHTPALWRRFRIFRNSALRRLNCFRYSNLTRRMRPGAEQTTGATRRFLSLRHTMRTVPRQEPLAALDEFRDMVKALHRAGIEVILDVVFNHTAEDGHDGPTQCFRGLDNPTYYLLCEDRSRYANFTGTGNTLNANHPVIRRMIVDSLRYWVTEMHVDGFRFDLASILARDSSGAVMSNPPVLWDIESEPALAGTKMIAEAWDAAGLYQVGSFVGDSWKEWNDHFRDDVRDFFRGADDSAGRMADRLLGSPGIYAKRGREAEESINFVACHDGFTLNDVVTFNHKHNQENGEDNRDGHDDNRSWNCGCEGPTTDPEIENLRNRQVKNFFTATMLSVGVPMFVMGDEVRRSQRGNNNAYCQDNEASWFDWTLAFQARGCAPLCEIAHRAPFDTGRGT